jgi:hypothetical protein
MTVPVAQCDHRAVIKCTDGLLRIYQRWHSGTVQIRAAHSD